MADTNDNSNRDLESMSQDELKQMAHHVPDMVKSTMSKQELIDAIKNRGK